MSATITIRPGTPQDIPVILALLDRATEWLVSQGRTGQWGTEPHSTDPRRLAQSKVWARDGGMHLAELDGAPVGALIVGHAPDHIPAATEPELYVKLLVTDRAHAGLGIGGRLLALAAELAAAQGVGLLRLDCYRGDDLKLVRYYQGQGFEPADEFTVDLWSGSWPGQVLRRRLS